MSNMPSTELTQLNIRVKRDLKRKLEIKAERLTAAEGQDVSVADVVRVALEGEVKNVVLTSEDYKHIQKEVAHAEAERRNR